MNLTLQMVSYGMDITFMVYLLKYFFCDKIKLKSGLWFAAGLTGIFSVYLEQITKNDLLGILILFLFLVAIQFFYAERKVRRVLGNLILCLQFAIIPINLAAIFIGAVGRANLMESNLILILGCAVDLTGILVLEKRLKGQGLNLKFQKAELFMLFTINGISLMIMTAITYFEGESVNGFVVMLGFSTILLNVFFCLFLMKNKTVVYYKEINEMNQYYMGEQLKYFEAYKAAQEDMRHFRHDIKNHILCLSSLCESQSYEQLKDYIQSLTGKYETMSYLYGTGNDVADAVINGKIFLLQKQDIRFCLEGRFTTGLEVEPVDLCCIFSNAMDNAIEENEKIQEMNRRFIKITIQSSYNFYVISFHNPVNKQMKISKMHLPTSKRDKKLHGFGLDNIRQAVKKYKGYVEIRSEEMEFILEVILPR